MSTMLATKPPVTHRDSLRPRPAKAVIERNTAEDVDGFEPNGQCVSLVFECIGAIGLSDKEAAYTMAMTPANLSRIKSGQQRLPFDAIWRLPDRFWVEFRDRIGEAKGLTERHLLKVRNARIAELVKLLLEGVA